MKVVSVLSGGLDSTVLTYKLVNEYGKDNVIALSFNYGQRHSIELDKAAITCTKLGIKHHIIDISFLNSIIQDVCTLSSTTSIEMPEIEDVLGDPQPTTYVPYRNMILNSIAFSFAESNDCSKVFSGLQVNDEYSYWDTTYDFINNMNNVSLLNRKHNITLEAPFAELSKYDEILIGDKLNVDFGDTWTCYRGEEGKGACGKCPSCSERIANFKKAGKIDPVPYEIDLEW